MSVSLRVLMPLPLNGMGVGYTCGSLAEGMADENFNVTIVTPRSRWPLPSVEVIQVLPDWARYIPYRWVRPWARNSIEELFLSRIGECQSQRSAAYLWPDASTGTIQELKRREVTVFREQFNCHTGTAKRILDQAYERLGVEPAHGITDEKIEREREILDAVDHVFCPSPMVEASLLENGVPTSKLLAATYGWDPDRLFGKPALLAPSTGITALFVGAICVRKGAHLLLDYWAKSGVKGRLVLAGEMEPIIKEKCASLLARDDVIVFDYYKNVGALYRSADMFIFPSLEEGSPLVLYEACGSGLPVITTNMGAGRIVQDEAEGFVLDPYDAPSWIAAIRELGEDVERRRTMSDAAAELGQRFLWGAVAGQRREQIRGCLGYGC
ncbi:glycosyltransferase [Bradyrhizobium sp. CSA112]|uniref:glycosyltransferase family 4 protein n=1 Tax=Bradyrhizobium sp. CSA112 TaxID=2699170 RepID=UPI0023AF4A9E|nr:glycosyltransferase family 4 protein [Bradyrhizobium sp. CSA112]MDE5452808.1 glycosyltransferase [Bradyrhizobium sp. CSA112]